MVSRLAGVILALSFSGAALADDESLQVATAFAKCSAYWEVNAGVMRIEPADAATAEHLMGLSRGSNTAALWMMASSHLADTNKSTRLEQWSDWVNAIKDPAGVWALSRIEQGDTASVVKELELCSSLLDVQQNIIDKMRKQVYTPQ